MADDYQRELLGDRLRGAAQTDPRWQVLADRLLAVGGELLAVVPEPDLGELIEHGRVWAIDGLVVELGERARCHHNAARRWLDDADIRWVTGWALSDDDVWRQHSWLVDGDETITETTEARTAYFGFVLTDMQAARAARSLGVLP
jgi:hypothetical protein